MLDAKEIFDTANENYENYQKRASINNVRILPLDSSLEYVVKALVDALNKELDN